MAAQLLHAVCLSGGYRSFDATVPSLREYVLEPWQADPFAVMEGNALRMPRCKTLLTVRGRTSVPHCLIGTFAEIAMSSPAVERAVAALAGPLPEHRLRNTFLSSMLSKGGKVRIVMVLACHEAIMAHEAARGVQYIGYAHIRPDLRFYQPMPAIFLEPYDKNEVRIPTGDEWLSIGPANYRHAVPYFGFNPDLQFADRRAFKAISHVWRVLADPKEEEFFVPDWTSEQLWRRAFEVAASKVQVVAPGGCKRGFACGCRSLLAASSGRHAQWLPLLRAPQEPKVTFDRRAFQREERERRKKPTKRHLHPF